MASTESPDLEAAISHINTAVHVDHRVLTFKTVAQELDLDANNAKRLLWEYARRQSATNNGISVWYFVMIWSEVGIVGTVVDADRWELLKQQLGSGQVHAGDKIMDGLGGKVVRYSVHVYGVAKAGREVGMLFLEGRPENTAAGRPKKMIIKEGVVTRQRTNGAKSASVTAVKPLTTREVPKPQTAPATAKSNDKAVRQPVSDANKKTFFDTYTSKDRSAPQKPATSKTVPPISTPRSGKPSETPVPEAKISSSSSTRPARNTSAPSITARKPASSSRQSSSEAESQRAQLQSMFDEDDSQATPASSPIDVDATPESSTLPVVDTLDSQLESQFADSDVMDLDEADILTQRVPVDVDGGIKEDNVKASETGEKRRRVRKRRKVKKTRHVKVGKYMRKCRDAFADGRCW
ncbi:hypothetical protein BC832DRAFT_545262 [Gaertneriomyces semiglobifer]|nr:hypothetical protein BC832DRAFT_545262 [Gaertneriomyces semiglobifer]